MQGAGIGGQGSASGVAPYDLLYATGGLSYGGTYLKTFPASFFAGTAGGGFASPLFVSTQNAQQNFNIGWTAGGGAEWMITQNWSVTGEALYYDLGNTLVTNTMYLLEAPADSIYPTGGSTTQVYYQDVITRAGINYHFNFA